MSKTNRIILIISMVIILIIGLFPPWRQVIDIKRNGDYGRSTYKSIPVGIRFILTPPLLINDGTMYAAENTSIYIDYKQLFMEWFIVIFLTAGTILIINPQKQNNEK